MSNVGSVEILLAVIAMIQLLQLASASRLQRRLDEFLERMIHVEAWAQTKGYRGDPVTTRR